ncbi:MAG: hypothetical protein AAB327_02275, partial [Actinomycetota bacterium]
DVNTVEDDCWLVLHHALDSRITNSNGISWHHSAPAVATCLSSGQTVGGSSPSGRANIFVD